MTDIQISPFQGIDVHTPEPAPEAGLLREAVNVDIDRDGGVGRRDGLSLVATGAVRSVHGRQSDSALVYVDGFQLKRRTRAGGEVVLGTVNDYDVEFIDVNGELIVVGLNTFGVVRGDQLQSLGIEDPPPPMIGAVDHGGFAAGTYGVLITFLAETGEESGASAAVFCDVAEGGGIEIQALPIPFEAKVVRARIYRTSPNGDVFYGAQDVDLPAPGAFLLNPGDGELGHACTTRFMKRSRGGLYARYWRGRILVARGRTLFFTDPMRYGLTDPRTGFIQLPTRITFIQPVLGGIFVGQRDDVLFLKGMRPADLVVERTGAGVPMPGSSTEIAGAEMSGDFAQSDQKYAVWLGSRGYVIGMPNGDVVEPQSTRLAVPVGQRGVTVVHNRRLTTLVT